MAEQRRYVSAGRDRGTNSSGLRTMVAQGPVGDIARVDALLEHLARLLKQYGDTDTLDVRRSKAFGLLANPALVCRLLAAARDAGQSTGRESDDDGALPADGPLANEQALPDPEETSPPSAVELAEAFGRVLAGYRGGEAWRRLRPPTSLVLHLSDTTLAGATACAECGSVGSVSSGAEDDVVRLEDTRGPLGPISLAQLRDLLDDQLPDRLARLLRPNLHTPHDAGVTGRDPRGRPPDGHGLRDQIVVRPVLDALGQVPVDAYEPPPDLREAVELSAPFEVFPWGTASSVVCDLDHTDPYRDPPDGDPPPGQTHLGNLGPLSRRRHNLETHHGWRCYQPLPGLFLWLTPTGSWCRVDHRSTTALGRDEPAVLRQRRRSTISSPDQVLAPADRAAPDLTRSRSAEAVRSPSTRCRSSGSERATGARPDPGRRTARPGPASCRTTRDAPPRCRDARRPPASAGRPAARPPTLRGRHRPLARPS